MGYERYGTEWGKKGRLILLPASLLGDMFSYGRVRHVLELWNRKLYVPSLGN